MRKDWLISSLTVFALLLSSTGSSESAQKVIAGSACSKAGLTSSQLGKKFTCIRLGKALQWDNGVPISKLPTPTPLIPALSGQKQPSKPSTPFIALPAKRVSMRIQAPLIERHSDGTPSGFYDYSSSSRRAEWATYYGPQLNTYFKTLPAGETFTITWKVTDADLGTPLGNEKVWLLVNGNSAGRQMASFSYLYQEKIALVPPHDNSINGQTEIVGTTDLNGLVSFTLRNLNYGTTADTCCWSSMPSTDFMNAFSNISLTTKRDYKNENRDFLWADFVNMEGQSGPEYKLIWSDEFTGSAGSAINSKYWTARFCGQAAGNGGGTCYNNESQYYTPAAVALDGSTQGNAVITTSRISNKPLDAGVCLNSLNNCSFTSARFDTQGKVSFLYGKFEARIKMPAGSGNWPAFWALGDNITRVGWPVSGEIDIAEQWRFQAQRSTGAIHYSTGEQGCCSNHSFDAREISGNDFSVDYHTYSMIWLPNSITLAVDGVTFLTKSSVNVRTGLWPFNEPIFLIFNNAISDLSTTYNQWSGWKNSTMSIDYLRVYSINGIGAAITS